MTEPATSHAEGEFLRVPVLFRIELRGYLIASALVVGLCALGGIAGASGSSFKHSSVGGIAIGVAIAILLLVFTLGITLRYYLLGREAGYLLQADGVLVVHPKVKNNDFGRGSQFVPWSSIAGQSIMGGRIGRSVGSEKRYYLSLQLEDGTRVDNAGVAVRYEHQRNQLNDAYRAIDNARRAALG